MEIKINHYPIHKVSCYDPKGNYLGELNEMELLDLRCQICKNDAPGFTFKANLPDWDEKDQTFSITSDGEIEGGCPEVLHECFSQDYELICRLGKILREKKNAVSYNEELPLSGIGTLIPVSEFRKQVHEGQLTSGDGFGYPVRDNKMNETFRINPSPIGVTPIPNDATHVIWFNS